MDVFEDHRSMSECQLDYRQVFDSSCDGKIVMDLAGRPLDANPAFLQLVKYDLDDLRALSAKELTPSPWYEQERALLNEQLFSQGRTDEYEKELRCADGSTIAIATRTILLTQNNKPVAMWSSARDIAPQKRLLKEREGLLMRLSQANRELEEILYATTHDLRAPLVNIIGFSRRIDKVADDLEGLAASDELPLALRMSLKELVQERLRGALRYIDSSARKMDGLIIGVLNFSRAGRVETVCVKVDVAQLMEELRVSLATQLTKSKARLEVQEVLPPCLGDYNQLGQVFGNLLDNALKYSDGSRRPLIQVSASRVGDEVIYRISDNGIGIAPEHHQRIWELFQRINPSGHVRGEGLGLAVVRRMVQRNQGRIWVESRLGEGTTFFLAFPAA